MNIVLRVCGVIAALAFFILGGFIERPIDNAAICALYITGGLSGYLLSNHSLRFMGTLPHGYALGWLIYPTFITGRMPVEQFIVHLIGSLVLGLSLFKSRSKNA